MKIKITLTIIGLLAFVVSCTDATNIVQQGEINDQKVFTNVANMQAFLNSTYSRLVLEDDIMASSLLTDEVTCASGIVSDDTQRFAIFASNPYANTIWDNHYNLINYCNRVIRGATYFTPSGGDVPTYNSILAQAKALRAFAHFELMVYFSTDISNPNANGVMLVDHVPTILEQIGISKNSDLFSFIDSDIAYADSNLIDPTGPGAAYKYVSHNFLDAFRARMYLYRKNYTQAQFYADKVITSSGLSLASCLINTLPANYPVVTSVIPPTPGGTTPPTTQPSSTYSLQKALYQVDQWTSAAAPDYRKMWVDASQGEVIFGLDRQTNSNNFSSRYNTNGSYLTGGPLFAMGRTLYDLYTQPLGGGAQDFRRWSFVDRSSPIAPSFSIVTPGAGYTNGMYDNISLNGGSGTGATAHITITAGTVSEFYFINQGSGYSVNDILTFSLPGASPTSTTQIKITSTAQTVTRTSQQIVIDKYPGKNNAHTVNDVKVFRMSEMYFIKAECAVRNNDLLTAASLIKQVRQARNYIVGGVVPTPVYSNAQAAFADILLERRKELCFEGHRYIDLKRLGADAGVTGTDRYNQDAVNSSALSPVNISLGDYRFTLPIPQAEINVNPLPQNPGY